MKSLPDSSPASGTLPRDTAALPRTPQGLPPTLSVHGGPAHGQPLVPWTRHIPRTIRATHYGPPDADGWQRPDQEAMYWLTPIGWVWEGAVNGCHAGAPSATAEGSGK